MSIATELTRIQGAKTDIKTAIEAKGVTVPSDALIDTYADYVDEIQTGGGTKDYIVESAEYDPTATYSGAFNLKKYITSATIPSGFTSIGNSNFDGCTSLTNITIPSTVTSIGSNAFYQCESLTSVTIPDSVTSIGYSAFFNCISLTSVTIPSGVTSINETAFFNCTSLTNITIPSTVTSIGSNAFQNSGLTSVIIPSSVTSIRRNAFDGCRSLTSLTVKATTPPTLGSNALINTDTNLVIYVPAESVDTYKAATDWSTYADRIQAIPSE